MCEKFNENFEQDFIKIFIKFQKYLEEFSSSKKQKKFWKIFANTYIMIFLRHLIVFPIKISA